MNAAGNDSGPQAALRLDAQRQLKAGTAPTMQGWGISVETLALLHRLASSPDGAGDALKLLHELQVHQVELDLQYAQLEANERELDQVLTRYRAMYELAPFAYFVLSPDGTVLEVNLAGASLLGLAREEIAGHPLTRFLASDSHERLAGLLQALHEGAGGAEG
ncbi:MAG TPA: PAS domain-containing protein, partial [Xanthomonadaceae bacterium]|nr:PAS domain-containing protein [Xanthomonadaceae bacterium]